MPFVRFTEGGKSFSPRATLSVRGLLSFNEGACRKYKIEEGAYGVLYYDRDTHRVAVELTKDESQPGARKIRLRKTGADIAAKSFVAYFDIELAKTTMYDIGTDSSTGWLVIDLNNGRERQAGTQSDEDDGDEADDAAD